LLCLHHKNAINLLETLFLIGFKSMTPIKRQEQKKLFSFGASDLKLIKRGTHFVFAIFAGERTGSSFLFLN